MRNQHFLDYITFEKRYSAHTLKAYSKDLEQFWTYIQEVYEVTEEEKITHTMLRAWVYHLIDSEEISPRSANRKLSCLKSYFSFLRKRGFIKQNPMTLISFLKTEKRIPEFVEEKAILQLLENVEFEESYSGKMNKLILDLFYQTGIRLEELINLKIECVDFQSMTIKVFGKRNKERIIPFTKSLEVTINHYLKCRNSLSISLRSIFLFIDEEGNQLKRHYIYNVVKQNLSKITSIKKKSPHVLRHTFATHMLNNGADLASIKDLLGHANLTSTQVYTHNSFEKLKSVYKHAHPRA